MTRYGFADPCGGPNITRPAAWSYSQPCPSPPGNASCQPLPPQHLACEDWLLVSNATAVPCGSLTCCDSPAGRDFTAMFCTPKNVTCLDNNPNVYNCMPESACPVGENPAGPTLYRGVYTCIVPVTSFEGGRPDWPTHMTHNECPSAGNWPVWTGEHATYKALLAPLPQPSLPRHDG